MDLDTTIRELAAKSDEPIRSRLIEYLALRSILSALTRVEEPNEAFLFDVLAIEDPMQQHDAALIAKRMRRLARQTFPRL